MKFIVELQEVWVREVTVEADDEEQAKDKAVQYVQATGDDDSFNYSYSLNKNLWVVKDAI